MHRSWWRRVVGVSLMVAAVLMGVSGCAGYACAPARWSGYSCPSPGAKVLP